jgi:hypothetical protein
VRSPRRATSAGTGNGALGYLVLDAIVEAQLADPRRRGAPRRLRAARFPTGRSWAYWTRRLANGGLVAAAERDLAAAGSVTPTGGPKLTGDEPALDSRSVLRTAVRRRRRLDGEPHLRRRAQAGRASEDELAPFGGEQAPTRRSRSQVGPPAPRRRA